MAMLQEMFSLNCQNRARVSEPPSRPIGLRPKFSQQENSIWSVFGKFFGSLKTAEISSAKRPWPSAESTTNWRIAQQEEGDIWKWQVLSKLGILILLYRSGIPATSEKFSTVHDPTLSYIAGDWPRKTFHCKLYNILAVFLLLGAYAKSFSTELYDYRRKEKGSSSKSTSGNKVRYNGTCAIRAKVNEAPLCQQTTKAGNHLVLPESTQFLELKKYLFKFTVLYPANTGQIGQHIT